MKHIVMIFLAVLALEAWAHDDDHEHKEEKEHKEEIHSDKVGHAHEEEAFSPKGGLLAADEHTGIKLSQTAQKNFELEMIQISGNGPWTVPEAAILHSVEEVNIYRLRDGFFKRVDFAKKSQSKGQVVLLSSDLKAGDQVVIRGVGFLRIAELSAFGGTPEGHSH